VVASPDALRHTVPKAFILLAPGYIAGADLARNIFQFVRRTVAPYKRVRRLEFSDLPKTISGKIRRVQLRREESTRPAEAERGAQEYFEEDFSDLS
jgi:acetyl-CoA synthetase